jgi:hypothetical protein
MLLYKQYMLRNILGDEGGEAGGSAGDAGGSGDKAGDDSGVNSADASSNNGSGGVDWTAIRQALPEELRDDKSLATINSVEGLVKGYVHSQKAMGSKVNVPDKHASEEDWQQFFHKVGAPASAEDYEFKPAEDLGVEEEFVNSFKEVGQKAGLLPTQLEQVFKHYVDYVGGITASQEDAMKAQHDGDVSDLKKEWGEAFDDNAKAANVAFKELLPDEGMRQRLLDDGLASHPAVVRLLSNAAKLFKEDTFIGHGEGKLGGLTPAEALDKAKDIQGNPDHPYRNPRHPNHQKAQKEVQDLYSIAFPG